MMKNIRHTLFSVLVSLALIVTLAGCSGSGNNSMPGGWNTQKSAEGPASSEPSPLTREALDSQAVAREIINDPHGVNTQPATPTPGTEWQYNTANNVPNAQPTSQPGSSVTTYPTDVYTSGSTQPVPVPAAAPSGPSVKVALLVPLSGKNADLGQAMMQAAQLALFDMEYDRIELVPQDTKGTPDGARTAAQLAIADGAKLILGPIFATEARAVAPIAQQSNINVISFSTDWTLAQGNTFVMGFLPFTQVERIVQYAAQQRLQRVGIIAPQNEYGNVVVSAWNVSANRNNMPPAGILRVNPGSAEASERIDEFTNGTARMTAAKAGQPLPPAPYDAIFMPVGGSEAVSLADSLAYYELDAKSVRRLGTGLWDDAALATQKNLDGAWFAASDPSLRKAFERGYFDAYGAAPPRLATLGYDAMSLAVVLAKSGFANYGAPSYDRASITNPNGFAGIDGIFRFRPDGMAERGLAILEFKNGSMSVVDPAPRSFVRSGY
jgi:ABC-type branched-subunit amino acid transport system substrate-binding protein